MTNTRKQKPKAKAKDTEQKAINIWQSLSSMGTGAGYLGNTLGQDLQLMSLYVNNDFVYSCAELNANTISTVPFKVYQVVKRGGATSKGLKGRKLSRKRVKELRRFRKTPVGDDLEVVELSEHCLYDLLNTDLEDLRGVKLIKLTQLYLEILGRAYWLVERSAVDGSPISIRVLMSHFVTPQRDVEGIVTGYFYTNWVDGKMNKIALDPSNVIDFREPSVSDPYAGGMSWVRASFNKISLDSKWLEYMNTVIDNRARPDYLISPKTDVGEDGAKRIQTKFEQKAGKSRNGAPIILEDAVTVTPLNFQPTDLAALQISDATKRGICVAAGIPGPMMGVEDKTYSNYETALEAYARGAVLPRVLTLEDVYNARLVPLFGDDVFIEFDNPVPEDKEFELEEQKVGLQKAQVLADTGSGSPNEIRAFLGLDERDEPGMDDLIQPTAAPATPGTVPTDVAADDQPQTAPQQPPVAPGSAAAPAEGQGAGAEAKAFETLLSLNAAVAKGKLPRAIAINIAERLGFEDAKSLVGFAPERKACGCDGKRETKAAVNAPGEELPHEKIKGAVSRYFKMLEHDAMRHVKGFASEAVAKADTGNYPAAFVDLDDWIENLKGTEDDLAYAVKPLIEIEARKAADGKGDALVRAGASPDSFSVVPAKLNKAMDKRAFKFAQSTLDTTQKSLRKAVDGVREAIRSGVAEGDSISELREAVKGVFEDASDYQAERIARTEVSAAAHIGQVVAAKASGVVKGFKYLVSSDACDDCKDYEDQTIDLDDYDDSATVDADGAVPIHPNCSCTLEEILKDVEEQEEE